jgi:hypothetical protein
MFGFYVRLALLAVAWCVLGVAVSLAATALGWADSPTAKAAIVAWVLFVGTAASPRRLYDGRTARNRPGGRGV